MVGRKRESEMKRLLIIRCPEFSAAFPVSSSMTLCFDSTLSSHLGECGSWTDLCGCVCFQSGEVLFLLSQGIQSTF